MELDELQKCWNEFGRVDPFWAVISHPSKKGGKWQQDEFFVEGVKEITRVMDDLAKRGLRVGRGRALDFGCGVGRLSRALAEHFDEVHGVDIAPSMIELADRLNPHGQRCRFHVNQRNDLRLFDDATFDFVYTNLVLQHMEPRYARKYIQEFLRVLVPGGLLLFQLPSEPTDPPRWRGPWVWFKSQWPRSWLNAYHRLRGKPCVEPPPPAPQPDGPVMEMHAIRRNTVVQIIKRHGGRVLDITPDDGAGLEWISYRYLVAKSK